MKKRPERKEGEGKLEQEYIQEFQRIFQKIPKLLRLLLRKKQQLESLDLTLDRNVKTAYEIYLTTLRTRVQLLSLYYQFYRNLFLLPQETRLTKRMETQIRKVRLLIPSRNQCVNLTNQLHNQLRSRIQDYHNGFDEYSPQEKQYKRRVEALYHLTQPLKELSYQTEALIQGFSKLQQKNSTEER